MKLHLRILILATLIALVPLAFPPPAALAADPIFVDDDGAECPFAAYDDIQNAIYNEPDGAVILVCGGTYPEFSVDNRRNLVIAGGGAGTAFVRPSTTRGDGAIVSVNNSQNIVIEALYVYGDNRFEIDDDNTVFDGIAFWNSSGTIRYNIVEQIQPNGSSDANLNTVWGTAIRAEGDSGSYPRVVIEFNLLGAFHRTGIAAYQDVSATISGNDIWGERDTYPYYQVGIRARHGAQGSIQDNEINFVNNGGPAISLYEVSGFKVTGNLVQHATIGIQIASGCSVVGAAGGNKISENRLTGITDTGINLAAEADASSACDPSVSNNKIQKNVIDTDLPDLTGVAIRATDTDGIGVGYTPVAEGNQVKGNTFYDFFNGVIDSGNLTKVSGNLLLPGP